MAEFEESTDSWEVKEERLRRALRVQVDTDQERKKESQGIVIQNLAFARKEEVVEEGRGDLDHGQDAMRNGNRSKKDLLRNLREKDIETEESVRSIEAKSAELHEVGLGIRGHKQVLPQKPFVPRGKSSIEGVSMTIQDKSIETQDLEPSGNSEAKLFEEERCEMEAENSQEQIFELDAEELSNEAKNDDGSLHSLPKLVTELSGQERLPAKAETPIYALQESGLGKQQQRERLNAMWQVSSAYVEPIAGIPNDPHVQTLDPNFSRHELQGDILNLDDAALAHQGPPLAIAVQGTTSSQAIGNQIVNEDPTHLDLGADSCAHPLDLGTGEATPEATTEVATAAPLERLAAEQEKEGSNVDTCDEIAKFDKGMSRFTLRTHLIFSIVYAIWIGVLYRFIATALC